MRTAPLKFVILALADALSKLIKLAKRLNRKSKKKKGFRSCQSQRLESTGNLLLESDYTPKKKKKNPNLQKKRNSPFQSQNRLKFIKKYQRPK